MRQRLHHRVQQLAAHPLRLDPLVRAVAQVQKVLPEDGQQDRDVREEALRDVGEQLRAEQGLVCLLYTSRCV